MHLCLSFPSPELLSVVAPRLAWTNRRQCHLPHIEATNRCPTNHGGSMQDLVVPPLKKPDHWRNSPLLGAPTRERIWLAFHRGRVSTQSVGDL